MKKRCVACHEESDISEMVTTYEWIHEGCVPWWSRRRELGPLFGQTSLEKAVRYAAIGLAMLSGLMLFAGCGGAS